MGQKLFKLFKTKTSLFQLLSPFSYVINDLFSGYQCVVLTGYPPALHSTDSPIDRRSVHIQVRGEEETSWGGWGRAKEEVPKLSGEVLVRGGQ